MIIRNKLISAIILVLFLMINPVKSVTNCNISDPCFCVTFDNKTFCYQTDIRINNHFNKAYYFIHSQNVSKIEYKNFNNIESSKILQKYKNLEEIIMLKGKINNLVKYAFRNGIKLQLINITYTNITNIDEKAFYNLPNLKEINLSNNNIMTIHRNSFYNLSNLEYLFLSFNKIKELPSDTFSKLPKLKQIDLRWNPIKKFQQNLFNINRNNFLEENSFLALTTENITCDSELFWIIHLLKYTKSDKTIIEFQNSKNWITCITDLLYNFTDSAVTTQANDSKINAQSCTVNNNVTIVNPLMNMFITLNYSHADTFDEDDTPDFEYK